jgi:hypothetical protein
VQGHLHKKLPLQDIANLIFNILAALDSRCDVHITGYHWYSVKNAPHLQSEARQTFAWTR